MDLLAIQKNNALQDLWIANFIIRDSITCNGSPKSMPTLETALDRVTLSLNNYPFSCCRDVALNRWHVAQPFITFSVCLIAITGRLDAVKDTLKTSVK